LRASEVVVLKVGDVDGARMTLRVEQGKGRKDRYALLSPASKLGSPEADAVYPQSVCTGEHPRPDTTACAATPRSNGQTSDNP
jgi:integrase